MTSVKIKIIPYGTGATLAHPRAAPDADACPPIVEIIDTGDTQARIVLRQFEKCCFLPLPTQIPWSSIKDARQGQIIR